MSDWRETTLGQACELYQPKTISGTDLVADGDYPVYGANGIIGKYDKYNHAEPQLLITCRGATCGAVNISLPNSWINGNAMVVRPRDHSVELDYLAHMFRGGLDLTSVITGAAQPQITRQSLAPLKVRFPALPEQRRIAAILDQADALRTKRREALAQLDNLTKSIFIEMFGDPTSNPKNWPVYPLEKLLVSVTNGLTRRRKDNEEGSDIVLRLREIRSGWIDFSEINRITLEPSEAKRFLLSKGDLLFIRVNGNPDYVGRCAVFEGYYEPTYFNDHVMRVKINHEKIHRTFLSFSLNGPHGKQEIAKYRKTSAGQHTINQDGLGKIQLPIPPIVLQSQFANRLNSIEEQKKLLSESLEEFDTLFASLQHRAFRGEL